MDPKKNKIVGDFIIAFCIFSSETVLKKSNLGRFEGAGSVKESVLEKDLGNFV